MNVVDSGWRLGHRRLRRARGAAMTACLLAGAVLAANPAGTPPAPEPPTKPREFYNAGTEKLGQGKLREAEALLETALASQNERLQPPALYNLGHVRFRLGAEELKKGPSAGPVVARSRVANQFGGQANAAADEALAGEDVQRMVAAYLRGKGVRKELKAALKAVKQAMDTYGAALSKWERSSGDFKSARELNPADQDARQNGETVDRCIARLVDSLRQMQQAASAMGDQNRQLGEKLKALKGKIPAQDMPPGAAGDDEEDEDFPEGPKPGQKEGPGRQGEEMALSPEQAAWLLEGFKLGGDRRLPMGQQESGNPADRNRPTW